MQSHAILNQGHIMSHQNALSDHNPIGRVMQRDTTPKRVMLTITRTAIAALCSLFAAAASAELAEPKVKPLQVAADPAKKAVLIGRVASDNMILQLELEGSEPMWMQMGTPPVWGAHQPTADERYHVELKLTDPKSKTRIPFTNINFAATNKDTGKTMTLVLPPMWGSSQCHSLRRL